MQSLSYLALKTGRALIVPNVLGPEHLRAGGLYKHRRLWPGYRVVSMGSPAIVEILEPGEIVNILGNYYYLYMVH